MYGSNLSHVVRSVVLHVRYIFLNEMIAQLIWKPLFNGYDENHKLKHGKLENGRFSLTEQLCHCVCP